MSCYVMLRCNMHNMCCVHAITHVYGDPNMGTRICNMCNACNMLCVLCVLRMLCDRSSRRKCATNPFNTITIPQCAPRCPRRGHRPNEKREPAEGRLATPVRPAGGRPARVYIVGGIANAHQQFLGAPNQRPSTVF